MLWMVRPFWISSWSSLPGRAQYRHRRYGGPVLDGLMVANRPGLPDAELKEE